MHLACSSVLCGGGTNQELAHHCLYESKGDIMVSPTEQSTLKGIPTDTRKMSGSCVFRSGDRSRVFFEPTQANTDFFYRHPPSKILCNLYLISNASNKTLNIFEGFEMAPCFKRSEILS